MLKAVTVFAVVVLLSVTGCGLGEEEGESGGAVNPTPTKENGERSFEFEPDDIERAEDAPESVQRYCEGAVSEAQEVGCLSHVEASEVP